FSADLLRPLDVINGIDKFFYVGDWGDMKIKKFDTLGQLTGIFGEGQGRGPGEVSNIMDFQVDSKNRLWVTDNVNSRFIIFDKRGNRKISSTDLVPTRVLPVSDDSYLFKPRFSSTPQIYSLISSEIEVSFEPLVRDPELWSYVLDSFYAIDSSRKIIRANVYTNDIVRYNSNGEIEYFRRTILPPDLREIRILAPREYAENQDMRFNEVHPTSKIN